jgi:N-acetylglucosamine repressor
MKTLVRGNRDLIKAMNRHLLLSIIRREGELSRTQLTEISGLSVGAVSQIINDLIGKNWVLETGEGDYTGGRRQMMLRLNPKAGYAIGLKLMENRVVCAMTDFGGTIVQYQDQAVTFDSDPYALRNVLAQVIDQTIASSGLAHSQIFGVGIGLAGVIYPQSGIVHYSPYFGWRDVPLAKLVQERLGLPVYVENDVNTLTLSELLFGAGRHQNHFVVITVGRGIGMGIIINGQLYQGSKGGAGEIGHIVLDVARSQADNAESGSLESLAADPAVIRTVREKDTGRTFTLSDVTAAAQSGDPLARAALERSGEYLGVGLASVINILSPNLVIISGEGVSAGDFRLKPMMDALKRYTFNGLLENVEVVIEPTDDRAWARGAASLVISKVFASPLVETVASH